MYLRVLFYLTAALLCAVFTSSIQAQSSAFTYQGSLSEAGSPSSGSYDLRFAIYDDAGAGTQQGAALTNTAVEVVEGVFTVTLDFGAGVFDGSDRWLEIGVVTNGGGAFSVLSPRQAITPSPYAIRAANAMTVAMGMISDPGFFGTTDTQPLQLQVNNEVGLRLEYPTIGTVPNLVGGYSGNSVGSQTQGAVIAGGGGFFNENTIGVNSDYSVIGGGRNNNIASNSSCATVVGGRDNDIGDNSSYATIAGGDQNDIGPGSFHATIGGGQSNQALDQASTVSGGRDNKAGNLFAVVAGGVDNNADGLGATIGGGSQNTADGIASTIGGGEFNSASGDYSTIPGGNSNAAADYAFAAGRRAKANHWGSFVWADSQDADFASTSSNQFLVRASGGVGIGTANPGAKVTISRPVQAAAYQLELRNEGSIQSPNFDGIRFTQGADGGTKLASIDVNYKNSGRPDMSFSVRDIADALFIHGAYNSRDGNVGIGTNNPSQKLHVVGNILATGTITPSSDRNLKKNFNAVNPQEVLDQVTSLPIQQWTYKAEADAVRHVGPMAQDFHAAFGLGANDTTIATVDADGVALAAIQGLHEKLTEELNRRDAENAELRRSNASLEQRLAAIELIIGNYDSN